MTAKPKVRLMPGQVVIREDVRSQYPRSIVIPDTVMADERSRKCHFGTVVQCGPPSRTAGGAAVDLGLKPGDRIVFHYRYHQKARTRPWPPDGDEAIWLTQAEVDGVIE